MITVHHLNMSRSHRIIWLLEELGIEYKIVHYQRDSKTMLAPAELIKINPLGTAPMITDGDITLAESGAIIEYLLERYGNGRLQPAKSSKEWIQYLFWLHFAEGSYMPNRLIGFVFEVVHRRSPFWIKPLTALLKKQILTLRVLPRLSAQLNYTESTLEKTQWLAGDEFTVADIQMGAALILSAVQPNFDIVRPKLADYIARLEKRPAYLRTLAVAGPLRFSQ